MTKELEFFEREEAKEISTEEILRQFKILSAKYMGQPRIEQRTDLVVNALTQRMFLLLDRGHGMQGIELLVAIFHSTGGISYEELSRQMSKFNEIRNNPWAPPKSRTAALKVARSRIQAILTY